MMQVVSGVIEPLPQLTPEEIVFVARNLPNIRALMVSGAFDIEGGSATIHFDAEGLIRRIDLQHTTFFKKAQ